MKSKIILILFAICSLLSNICEAQNITNTLGTGGYFYIKDGATTFAYVNQVTGYLTLNKSLTLSTTTGSTDGVIYKGANSFLHNYGAGNTFLGVNSGNFTMTGSGHNIAVGNFSLSSNTTGNSNIAIGYNSLSSNTTGYNNTALGYYSLVTNTSGHDNTALGYQSLQNNNGSHNTAVGYNSLYSNTSGHDNTAMGYQSLQNNNSGGYNTALGNGSLSSNLNGGDNVSIGYASMFFNTYGGSNIAMGTSSLYKNIDGNYNIALGNFSLYNNTSGFQNTGVGYLSLTNNTGNYNTALGYNAGSTITTGANLTCIGIDAAPTTGTATNEITLGNVFVTSLRCAVTSITSLSDKRDKKNITDLSLGLEFISKLKPRQFNWDKREWYENNVSDGSKMKGSKTAGFIAQELDEAQTSDNAEWLNLVLKNNPDKWEATYGNLLPVMVKAIQELKTENDSLKDKLAKFEQMQNIMVSEIEKLKSNHSETKEIKLSEK